jgi:hypothetical protein
VGSLVFLSIFFILTLADTMERGQVDPIKAREIQSVPARPELETVPGHGEGHEPGAVGETGEGHEAGGAPADSGGGH